MRKLILYHYYFLYKEDNDILNKCQITQEEFKRADEWTNDIDEINQKKIESWVVLNVMKLLIII